jgi:hypothetical protein
MSVGDVVGRFTTYIINPALLVLAAAGFFFFVWGLVQFLWTLNQGGEPEEGKQHMIWGVVGMVIMFSVIGIIALINNTFGLGVNVNSSGTGTYTPNTSNLNNINTGASFFQSGQ